jgi:mRNA interferase YafQ
LSHFWHQGTGLIVTQFNKPLYALRRSGVYIRVINSLSAIRLWGLLCTGAVKRDLDMNLIRKVMEDLENEVPLDRRYKNHALTGIYIGNFKCHIRPDWPLIYHLTETAVIFVRTGSHSDLFE